MEKPEGTIEGQLGMFDDQVLAPNVVQVYMGTGDYFIGKSAYDMFFLKMATGYVGFHRDSLEDMKQICMNNNKGLLIVERD